MCHQPWLLVSLLVVGATWMSAIGYAGEHDVIRALENVEVFPERFENSRIEKPVILRNKEALDEYFSAAHSAQIAEQIDFKKHAVVLFLWQGSGQDRLDYSVEESHPVTIKFRYQRGLSRDLRRHAQAYIIRTDAVLSFEGHEIPLAGDPATRDYIRVEVRGIINAQVMAIGGETTGVTISAGQVTWELDIHDPEMRAAVEKLHGRSVVVRGTLQRQQGVEIRERWIVTVESFSAAND